MSGGATGKGPWGPGEGGYLLCTEPESKGEQHFLQFPPVQVATPIRIKEDKSKKTVQGKHSRGVQFLGLHEKKPG